MIFFVCADEEEFKAELIMPKFYLQQFIIAKT